MTVLIFDPEVRSIDKALLATLTAGRSLADDIHLLLLGEQASQLVEQAKAMPGVTRLLLAPGVEFQHGLAETIAPLLQELTTKYAYTHILAPANTSSKNVLPRLAAKLKVAQISDVIAIESADVFKRSLYAGNLIAKVRSNDAIKLLTIRTSAFASQELSTSPQEIPTESINYAVAWSRSQWVSHELTVSERPELQSARIVVSGGRALKSKEQFEAVLNPLADVLNAGVGASRAAVDAGYAPNDYQVGQTGKIIAPDLYIAVGISGAVQHMAGMSSSKVIVAINKDPEAEMMKVADYALEADLFDVVPELTEKLKAH
jgi:electron transfer flavoprotein alpha subunit